MMPRYLDELQFNVDLNEGDIDVDVGLADEFQAEIDINVNTGDLDIDFGIGDESDLGLLTVDEVEEEVEEFVSLDIDLEPETAASEADNTVTLNLEEDLDEATLTGREDVFELNKPLEELALSEFELLPNLEGDLGESLATSTVIDIDIPIGRSEGLDFGDEFGDDFDRDDFIFNPKRPFGL